MGGSARLESESVGAGWFDTGLRETPARLTTNGFGAGQLVGGKR